MAFTPAKNTTNQHQNKPPKPAADFPLFAHGNGQWAKKIQGRLHYFGNWADPDGALQRYRDHQQVHPTPQTSIAAAKPGQIAPGGAESDSPGTMPAKPKRKKTKKPSAGFPLYAHTNGQWAKRIRGTVHYFGPHADPAAALQRYLDEKDDLLAGRAPIARRDALTLRELMNRYLTAKAALVDSGELKSQTFDEYRKTCAFMEATFGLNRYVDSFGVDDFRRLRKTMAAKWGPVRLANQIQRVRSVFKYAYDNGLIERPVRFGSDFRKPTARVLRTHRARNGHRMFEAAELRRLLKAASPQLRAMILLGVNCGFGNSDVAALPKSAIDLNRGWVDFPRPKTGIARRCPLWPETVSALKTVLATRPQPKKPECENLVFISERGKSYGEAKQSHWLVAGEFRRLLKKQQFATTKRGFYGLRHTFETIGGESRDQVAVDHIMGHAPQSSDMSAVYRERISDERLKAVTDHVRRWLFGDEASGDAAASTDQADASSAKKP